MPTSLSSEDALPPADIPRTPRHRIPWRRAKSGADTLHPASPQPSLKSESVSDESFALIAPGSSSSASTAQRPNPLRRISAIFKESDGRLEENLRSLKRRVVQVRRQPDGAPVRFEMGFRSRTGWEPIRATKQNQDCIVALVPWGPDSRYNFFATLDGHGRHGHRCAIFVAQRIISYLNKMLHPDGEYQHVVDTLHRAVAYAERRLEAISEVDFELSGSTGVFVLVHGSKLYCANIGDSRAVIGRVDRSLRKKSRTRSTDRQTAPSAQNAPIRSPKSFSKSHRFTKSREQPLDAHTYAPIQISIDQKPSRPDEKARLLEAGARVDAWEGVDVGEERVWLPEARTPGLAVSRSFGDLLVKKYGVNCVPEVYSLDLSPDDHFLVMASDGVFEFISSEEVIHLVGKWREHGTAQEAAEELVKIATERWILDDSVIDDISCIVVFLEVLPPCLPHQPRFAPSSLYTKQANDIGSARTLSQRRSLPEGLDSPRGPLRQEGRLSYDLILQDESFFDHADTESL